MKTIGVVSLAGGQGKTTVSFLLGLYLSEAGKRVCWVDCDPQASLTIRAKVGFAEEDPTLLEVIKEDVSPLKAVYPSEIQVPIIPADRALESAKTYLATKGSPATVLKRVLRPLEKEFDYLILDSHPQVSHLTVAVCGASDYLVIPTEASSKGVTIYQKRLEGSLPSTLKLLDDMDAEEIKRGEVLAIVPFRDKWVGRNQTRRSSLACQRFQKIADLKGLKVAYSILESEKYQSAMESAQTLSEIGEDDLGAVFDQLVSMLEGK